MGVRSYENERFAFTADFWATIVLSGLIAGVLMGVVMYLVMGIMQSVAGLYTLESTIAGWAAHLAHSVIFALAFGVAFAWPPFDQYRTEVLSSMSLGIIWGVVLWLFAAGIVMPAWLGAVGPASPPVPAINPISGLGHILYGAALGSVFAALQSRY